MKILLLGASGFIGSAIAQSLVADGHELTGLGRSSATPSGLPQAMRWVQAELRDLQSPQDWAPIIAGQDAVINASGALQTGLRDNVTAVQLGAMRAAYIACAAAGVSQFIQISAAGAQLAEHSEFMSSKGEADAALAASGLHYTIMRPGLVVGRNCFGGTELLRAAAAMPLLLPVPSGAGEIQTAALSDVTAAVRAALSAPAAANGSFDLVEAQVRSLGEIIAAHRAWLGLPNARWHLPLAPWLLAPVRLSSDLLGWLGWRGALRSNAAAALTQGITGDASQTRRLLGREPLSLSENFSAMGQSGKADRWHARIALLYPWALVSLFLLWLGSGILGIAYHWQAAQILTGSGMSEQAANFCVYAGSAADIAIAAGIALRTMLARALKFSLLIAAVYLAGSLIWTPYLWLDPLGSMLKILPILMLTAICLAISDER